MMYLFRVATVTLRALERRDPVGVDVREHAGRGPETASKAMSSRSAIALESCGSPR